MYELYLKIIYNIIKKQNEMLLHEISVRENIDLKELREKYLPSYKKFREYVQESAKDL